MSGSIVNSMQLKEREKVIIENLLKIFKRAKFDDFQGAEALAFAEAWHWLHGLAKPQEPIPPVPTSEKVISIKEVKTKPKKK